MMHATFVNVACFAAGVVVGGLLWEGLAIGDILFRGGPRGN